VTPALLGLLRCPRSGTLLRLTRHEGDGDDVETGLLHSEAGVWPVLGGIPVLTDTGAAVVPLVTAGRAGEAMAEVAFQDRPATRPQAVLSQVARHGGARSAAAAELGRRRGRRQDARLFTGSEPLQVLERLLLHGRPAMPDAWSYFRYRFGLPRHLVALQLVQALGAGAGPVLDLGCGAGHMTFSLTCLRPDAHVVGVDLSFAQLWVARTTVAPSADYVCADARALPFADGAFPQVLSVDVLSFVADKWPAVREAQRVLAPGGSLAVTSVKDAQRRHVYAGMPLSSSGWVGLFGGAPVRLLDDDDLLDRYLAGQGLPDQDAPTRSATVSLLRGGTAVPTRTGAPPHAVGPLGVNPLYRATPAPEGAVRLVRSLPGGSYAADNERLLDYLPETALLPRELAEAGARGERPEALLDLARAGVVLALPPGYVPERWPGAGADGAGRAVAW
jgi:SAM-dependent methyltransferase